MKNIFLSSLAFTAIILLSSRCTADENGGSGYSRYGIGDIRYFNSARSAAMGGAGIALSSPSAIDRLNPALWGKINHTLFSASALYEGFSTTDGVSSAFLSDAKFNGMMIAFPISPEKGITFAGGFVPYSRVNYNILSPLTLGTENYTLQYEGDGGVSLAHIGLSYSPTEALSFGAKLDYYFGTINRIIRQSFPSSSYTSAEATHSLHVGGVGVTFGAVYSGLSQLFNFGTPNSLSAAAYFSTTSSVTTTEELRKMYNTGGITARDTTTFPDGTLHIPYAAGFGIAYQSERFNAAADFVYQQWSGFTVNGATSQDLRNSYRVGGGVEFLPKREAQLPFVQRISYRMGSFYNSSYYNINGQGINEFGITGGLGMPIFLDTRLNIAAEYSFRGTTDLQMQKDKILRLSLTLNIGEHWFVRPEEE